MLKFANMETPSELWQVSDRHFCAGLDINSGSQTVRRAAPILRYMVGWGAAHVREYCKFRRWKLEKIS